MFILDCTLRDGGFSNRFQWDKHFVFDYYNLMKDLGIEMMEVGYWGHDINRFDSKFYSLETSFVNGLFSSFEEERNLAIMMDYHRIRDKDVKFPSFDIDKRIGFIRVFSVKELVIDCIRFCRDLRSQTGIPVSLNLGHINSYDNEELFDKCRSVTDRDVDCVYFADSNGSFDLDLRENQEKILKSKKIINGNGVKFGCHFHSNLNKDLLNYIFVRENGCDYCDTTINGIGKGAGNLRLEDIFADTNKRVKIISFVDKYSSLFKRSLQNLLYITGLYDAHERYAQEAQENFFTIEKFTAFCKSLSIEDRLDHNPELIKEWLKRKNRRIHV